MQEGIINQWRAKINLETATARQFAELVAEFNEFAKQFPDPAVELSDGWHEITPELAEKLLIANASNRRVSFSHVLYLAEQMKAGDWPETGQSLILTPNKRMDDGQHRSWASLLSGASFVTYVVNQRTE